MGEALIVRKGGSENLSSELSAQDTLITNITESLVGRATDDITSNPAYIAGYEQAVADLQGGEQ